MPDWIRRGVGISVFLHALFLFTAWLAAPVVGRLLAPLTGHTRPPLPVVHFHFAEQTADVSESSRTDQKQNTPLLGRFESRAMDRVRDDKNTPFPAGGIVAGENSLPGTGAEESPGDPGAAGDEGRAERRPPSTEGLRPALDGLPTSVERMLTGRRAALRAAAPGLGARRSSADAGALEFGDYSFSTTAWDYEPYWVQMRRKLYAAWNPPAAYRMYGIIDGGWTVVRAVIERDGRLSSAEILGTQGHESLHRASLAAMEGAAPFRALPADFPEDKLVVTVRFVYLSPGVRPPEEARSAADAP